MRHACLYLWIIWELVRYDFRFALLGMRGVRPRPLPAAAPENGRLEQEICEAVRTVAPLYWKPIRCLERSIVTVQVMRRHGIPAQAVIGYRAKPFFGHAWVEVAGRIANDSRVYQREFQVLERL